MSNEWQPIETAPKDGTPIIGLTPKNGYFGGVIGVEWNKRKSRMFDGVKIRVGGFWARSCRTQIVECPTHWMPLPKPPTQ
jgi:hypothetical protein